MPSLPFIHDARGTSINLAGRGGSSTPPTLRAIPLVPIVLCLVLLTTSSTAAPIERFLQQQQQQQQHLETRELRTTKSSMSSSGSQAKEIAVDARSSSCTWREEADATGRCVLAPRSCYDCLNVRPTSGETCTLLPTGMCAGAESYNATLDYRRQGAAVGWVSHPNHFPAANTTYCEPTDAACGSCRGTSFRRWEEEPSRHCFGKDGCVCVAICERPEWEATLRGRLEEARVANASLAARCSLRAEVTDTQPAEGVGNTTVFVGLDKTKAVLADADPCMWYQNQTLCGAPRTCADCLNVGRYSGKKCMLHSSGYCTTMDAYRHGLDYRRRGANASMTLLFPGNDTRYCDASDATCRACRDGKFQSWANVSSPPQFCVGVDGCVCLASCESPQWKTAVVNLTCNTKRLIFSDETPRLSVPMILVTSFLGCIVSAVCALMLLGGYRRHRRRAAAASDTRRRRDPTAPQLELTGWKALREELIQHERDFVGMTSTTDPATGPRSRAISATAAAAAETVAEDEPPAQVIVEHGDAFRPMSPSRMHA